MLYLSKFVTYSSLVLSLLIGCIMPALSDNSSTPDEDKGYHFELKVKGIQDSACYLAYHYGHKIMVLDTFQFDNKGTCIIEGEEPIPGGIYIAIIQGAEYFEFIYDGKEENIILETDIKDYVHKMKVKNSKENELFNGYQRYLLPRQDSIRKWREAEQMTENEDSLMLLDKNLTVTNKELREYRKKAMEQHKGTFYAKLFETMKEPTMPEGYAMKNGKTPTKTDSFRYYKNHFWDNVDFTDTRLTRTPLLVNKTKQYLERLTTRSPDSLIVACERVIKKTEGNPAIFKQLLTFITSKYEQSKIMGHDAVFVHLADTYYLTGKADWMPEKNMKNIRERVLRMKPNLIGKQAPQITLEDSTGKPIPLYSLKSDYIVIYFWSYTCGHCKKSLPAYQEIYEKYKDKGVDFYSVCTKIEKDKWLDYIKETNMTWTNVFDPKNRSPFRMLYDVHSTPTVYLLDQDRKIVAKRVGAKQLDMLIQHFKKLDAELEVEEDEENFKMND